MGKGKPRLLQLSYCCGYHPDGLCDWGVRNIVHMVHHLTSPQVWRQVLCNWPSGGALGSHHYHNWLTFGGLHLVPRYSAQVQSLESNRDGHLEAKLLQNIAILRQEVLSEIFVDIHKYYDTLYPGHDLEIMEGYKVVPHLCQLLTWYCYQAITVASSSGY